MIPRGNLFKCNKCGYEIEKNAQDINKYKVSSNISHSEKEKIIILENVENIPTGSQVIKGEISCPSCGNDQAYFWILQTRRADEPPTRFYKCTKCGKVWREYQ
jgi:DNA-directed RNA polymerase subunit M